MSRLRLRLVGYDEGGIRGTEEHVRLVCELEDGGLIAIWGQDKPTNEMKNIEAVRSYGMPCIIECDATIPSTVHMKKYGHKYWVPHDSYLNVIPPETI